MSKIILNTNHLSRFGVANIVAKQHVSLNMIRVTLQSNFIKSFDPQCAGGHIKIVVPAPKQTSKEFSSFIATQNIKDAMRTYTVRHVRLEKLEIDIDIAIHGNIGRVGQWVQKTNIGDEILISHHGSPKLISKNMNRILAATDLTGFPALAAGLGNLTKDIILDAYIEIPTTDDKQPINLKSGQNIHWIINNNYASSMLSKHIKTADKPDENTSIFVAGEFSTVNLLRSYFRHNLNVNRRQCYISSYWKYGSDEIDHKIAKAEVTNI
jgi:NADPH-dependent ferric siderophore reductase